MDIGIASAKVEMEYAKQMAEHKDRLYIWYRDKRIVKNAWIARVPTDNMVRQCVTADFRQAVATLPARDIVRKYGTHWVSRAWLGGRMDYYFTVSQSVKASAESIALTVTVKFLCWSASASTSVSEKTWSEIQQDFEGNFEVSGGGTAGDVLNKALADAMKKGQPLTEGEALIGAWIDRFGADAKDEDLTMVDFEVKPIHELVGALDAKKGEEVKRYIENEYKK